MFLHGPEIKPVGPVKIPRREFVYRFHLDLRAAVGLLPEYGDALTEIATLSSTLYQQTEALGALPQILLTIEFYREAATVVMLATIALLATKKPRNRFAVFLWIFAIWDIFYYVGLWVTVRWPPSLVTQDVLFLIPNPWLAQVWFPLLVSILTLVAVVTTRSK